MDGLQEGLYGREMVSLEQEGPCMVRMDSGFLNPIEGNQLLGR